MSILDRIRKDTRRIVSDSSGFAFQITFSFETHTAIIKGTGRKHHIVYDDQGNVVNVRIATITVSEKDLTDAGYPTRNSSNQINLKGHKVSWDDAFGTHTYNIEEWLPDEYLGLIVCQLRN